MIERNQYLSKLISVKNNGFPKIITGIRRCGKSYLLKEIFKKHLIETGVSENQIIIFPSIHYCDVVIVAANCLNSDFSVLIL